MFRRTRLSRGRMLSVAGAAVSLVATVSGVAVAATLTNTAPNGLYKCSSNTDTYTAACLTGAVGDFNTARAKEGLGALTLPSNFASLSNWQQMLVLTNLDRVARGLQPIAGLNTTLNSIATAGANSSSDPAFPSWAKSGGSNWASTVNTAWSEFLWMYYDGYGATNGDCTSATATGCWGHRRNILATLQEPVVMGAGTGSTGDATIFLGADTHDAVNGFTWASEAKYFPRGVLPTPKITKTTPRFKVSASGGNVTWSLSGVDGNTVALQHLVSGKWSNLYTFTNPTYSGPGVGTAGGLGLSRGTYRFTASANTYYNAATSAQFAIS